MNSWWEVLEVARDSDRAAIRRAYARKLKHTNPEDDPQGFMALREAYETALHWIQHRRDADVDEDWNDIDPVPVPAPEPEPVSGFEPVHAATPLPAVPDPEAFDPEAEAAAAEHAALRADIAALEAGLRGPWFRDGPALAAQLDAILAAPAMMAIDTRDSVEHWLAFLIADTIPRSDPILMRAIAAFGWEEEGNRPPPAWQILARIDEWRLIEGLAERGHALAPGWRALTRTGEPGWRRRIGALRPGIAAQVRRLFELADYQTPGLAHSFDPGAVAWWRAHLDRPRFGFLDLATLLLGGIVATVFALEAQAPLWRIGGAVAAVLAGIAFPVLRLHLVAPFRARREAVADSWVDHGWIGLWLCAGLLLIGLPDGLASAAAVVVLSTGAVLWMALVTGREPELGNPLARIFSFGVLAVIGAAAFMDLTGSRQLALGAFGIGSVLLSGFAGAQIAHPFWRVGARPVVAVIGVTVALLAAACVRSLLPAAPPPLTTWGTAAIAGMVLMAAVRDVHDGSWGMRLVPWLRWGLWVTLIIAAGLSTPIVERNGLPPPIAVTDPMEQLETREPGFGALRTGNPALHAAVAAVRRQMADGKRNGDEGAREIDRLVNKAYRERLPHAPAALIASEFAIRLVELREYEMVDPRACAGGERQGTTPALSEGLQRRHYRHALAVAASKPAPPAELAQGRQIPMDELLRLAAGGDAASAARHGAALRGDAFKAKCAARIAVLEALTAQPDATVAKTMRPALLARAEPSSTK